MSLDRRIKEAATAAVRGNARLGEMSPEDRETAAKFYESVAAQTVGTRANLAPSYNLERARFLRGEVSHIAATADQYGHKASPGRGGSNV